MSISTVTEKELGTKSQALLAVKNHAEEVRSFAEANGINIIIVMADQKAYDKNESNARVAMSQLGHIHQSTSDIDALYALSKNMDRAKDILESKIMQKMIELNKKGELNVNLSDDDKRKLAEITKFYESMEKEGELQ